MSFESNTLQLHFFKFNTFASKFWAFTQMQLAHAKINQQKGIKFYKLLGTGGGDGFQWYPDFSRYALLINFENTDAANCFKYSKIFNQYQKKSTEHAVFYLQAYESHGFWSGIQPFETFSFDETKPIAVITRARIKWQYLLKFWSYVPKTSASLSLFEGRLIGKGIGEWPLIQQATFSIWTSQNKMNAYAYQNPKHREVIKKTRQLGWYSEELFARFHPLKMEGTYEGQHFNFVY